MGLGIWKNLKIKWVQEKTSLLINYRACRTQVHVLATKYFLSRITDR